LWQNKPLKKPTKIVYKIDLKHDDGHKLTLKSNSASIFAGFPVDEPIEVSVKPMNTLDEFEDTPELTSEEE
jgi:hypothetical protein